MVIEISRYDSAGCAFFHCDVAHGAAAVVPGSDSLEPIGVG
jgi:hypothetical protein